MPDTRMISGPAEAGRGRTAKGGGTARRRRTPRIADLVLDQLPAAVAVVNDRLEVTYCNARAVNFFALPSFALRDGVSLADLLNDSGHLPPRCTARLIAFCGEQLAAPDDGGEAVLRLSLSRATRLAVRMRRIERRSWMLMIDDRVGASADTAMPDAWLDPLTRLSNRRRFNQALEEQMRGDADDTPRFSLLMIDLDRFKTVNDTLGHPVGDALLCLVAQRLRREIRDGDMLARLGGDEFALLAHGTGPVEALGMRIVDVLSRPFLVEGTIVNIGASVGIAHFPAHGGAADELMRHADLALYDAKSSGRGAVRVFLPEMAHSARARRELETDLGKAVALGEFSLMYQPQLNVRSGTVTGFEALLRWNHPVRGVIPPSEFIPLAEEIGCIQPLGEWVLRKACTEAARWPSNLTIAVNVSPRQLQDTAAFADAVHAALALSGLAPARLELEITESALLDPHPSVRETLHRLCAEGVRIAMDDFGIGYPSLNQLRSFPFSRIKIDRSFIAGLGADSESAAVVKAITALGAGLGMTTTAEGVETFEQAALAEADGCTDIQGFLVSQPVPAAEIDGMLCRPRPSGGDAFGLAEALASPPERMLRRVKRNARTAVVHPSTVVAES